VSAEDGPGGLRRSAVSLIALVVVTAALALIALCPNRATLWPAHAAQWLSRSYGAIGLDEPPRR
jgi:hypothetical protein